MQQQDILHTNKRNMPHIIFSNDTSFLPIHDVLYLDSLNKECVVLKSQIVTGHFGVQFGVPTEIINKFGFSLYINFINTRILLWVYFL